MEVQGLTSLTTEQLKKLLKYLHDGSLETPLTAHSIACVGFQFRHAELMNTLRGLGETGVRAVLVSVLAERIKAERDAT
jgi:hypothetical protein